MPMTWRGGFVGDSKELSGEGRNVRRVWIAYANISFSNRLRGMRLARYERSAAQSTISGFMDAE